MHEIGRVVGIYRYVVKSMAAQPLQEARLGWHGLDGDRRYAFRRTDAHGGFPWLSASRLPELIRYRPHCADDADIASASSICVVTPDGDTVGLVDEALRARISNACGHDVALMQLQHGMFDEASISLISTQTIRSIEREAGTRLDARRFRPNVLVEIFGDLPNAEDAWVGQQVTFDAAAGAAVCITQRDPRCAMINIDPDTGAIDPHILKTVVRSRENLAGVYGVPIRTGTIKVGSLLYNATPPLAVEVSP